MADRQQEQGKVAAANSDNQAPVVEVGTGDTDTAAPVIGRGEPSSDPSSDPGSDPGSEVKVVANNIMEDDDGSVSVMSIASVVPAAAAAVIDPRMQLSKEEQGWAISIKNAILGLPDVDNLQDFDYAQLALIEQDNVDGAVRRAYQLQDLKGEYEIRDTCEDSHRKLIDFVKLLPEFFLSFSYVERDGCYVGVTDLKSYDKTKLKSVRNLDAKVVASNFYIMHASCPDFASIRQGTIVLFECDGYDWKKHLDVHTYRLWQELLVPYPIYLRKVKHFNSGMFVNMLHSMTKHILPKGSRDTFEVGCKVEGGYTLDQIFLVPDLATANAKVQLNYSNALKLRYKNAKEFSLPAEAA